ncbi:MAG: cytochrome c, partial [Bacteroidetes bacterium]
MTIKNKIIGAIAFGIGVIGVSCNNVPNSPGWEYMPDMYRSTSYETNSGNPNFADSMTNRQPAAGTVSQGWIANSEYSSVKAPYPYKFDSLGYELAGQNLRNPFPASADVVAQGKDKYDKFCVHCHGASGMGDGAVVEFGNFPPPPAYNSTQLKNLPEGKMYHTLQYGKGMMGSHASQLTPEERWKILRYVQTLQNPGGVTGAGRVMVTPPIYPEGAMVDSVGNVI